MKMNYLCHNTKLHIVGSVCQTFFLRRNTASGYVAWNTGRR